MGPASQPSAAHPNVIRPSVTNGSSGIWFMTGSATPRLRTMAPAEPPDMHVKTLNPSCHLRRVLRSWKNWFQSSGGRSGLAAAWDAEAAAAAAASWFAAVDALRLVMRGAEERRPRGIGGEGSTRHLGRRPRGDEARVE